MKQASWVFIVGACGVAAGCGQKGPLYLPDKNASVVTRPANTTSAPQPAPAPAKPPQDKNGDDSQSGTPKS